MDVVIIEDEKPAAEKLKRALLRCHPQIRIMAVLGSVKEAVAWLKEQACPDLMFMDIELGDGISFSIFDEVKPNCPVIFTTAFDEYWQEAFEYNSIDYLLKPVKEEKLRAALQKYESLQRHFASSLRHLLTWHSTGKEQDYRKRFLVKRGTDYYSIRAEDVAYCYATHKLVCLVDRQGQKFILDQSLSEIEKQLDPGLFYRVNRKYLVQQAAIHRIKALPKSRLLLELHPGAGEEIIISQENVVSFKTWMDR